MVQADTRVRKSIYINHQFTDSIIEMSQDKAISIPILDISFIVVAVNGEFRSPSISMNLETTNSNMIGVLNFILKNIGEEDDYNLHITGFDNIDELVVDYSYNEVDDLHRQCITISYISPDSELMSIKVPLTIVPELCEVLIKIITDKEIAVDEPEEDVEEESDETESDNGGDKEPESIPVE